MTRLLQLRAESTPVVNLPIESQDEPAIRRHHRLVTELTEIKNRQPSKRQRGTHGWLDPFSRVVRTAVTEAVGHFFHQNAGTRFKATGGVEPGKAAHYKLS